jgi:hypothetical protein
MDYVKNLSRETQAILGGGVLYLIFSFLDWQQVSGFGFTVGRTEWNGVGIIAGLLVIVLLVWEAARLFAVKVPLGTLSEGLVSLGIALLLALFTVITFATHGTARHWPAWVGLILSLVIAVAAVIRARAEGVQMPQARSTGGMHEPQPVPPTESAPEAPAAPEE